MLVKLESTVNSTYKNARSWLNVTIQPKFEFRNLLFDQNSKWALIEGSDGPGEKFFKMSMLISYH